MRRGVEKRAGKWHALPLLLAVTVTLLAACAPGREEEPFPAAELPPDGTEAMAAQFGDRLAGLGWKVQRSALEQQHFDTDVSIPPGKRHLAVYLRPTGQPGTQGYIDGLAASARLFVPTLFGKYNGLASFDVCLEPTEAQDPSPYPKPLVQLLVTRRQAESGFEWGTAQPVNLVAGVYRHPNVLALTVSDELEKSPEWEALRAAAAASGG